MLVCLNGLLQGVLGGVFFGILGLKAQILFGVLRGILSCLPIFGISLP